MGSSTVRDRGDYSFDAKKKWRRKIWNEIGRRVINNRGATVLYLPGPDDLDRREAMRKGFSPENLIGVDGGSEIVRSMKDQGKLAVQGRMGDVLLSWPKSRPVQVVVADTCNVFGTETKNIITAVFGGKMSSGGIAVINIQRGREQGDDYEFIDKCKEWFANKVDRDTLSEMTGELNRGWALMHLAINLAINPDGKRQMTKQAQEMKLAQMNCRIGCYRSGVTMDSILFSVFPECEVVGGGKKKLARKITATLAVQTMRQNGKLPRSPKR